MTLPLFLYIEIGQLGSWAIALINFIGLIVVWTKDSKKKHKIKELEDLSNGLKAQNQTLLTGLADIRRELGIGTQTKLYAKKAEIQELVNQVKEFEKQTQALEKNNDIIIQQGDYLKNIDRPFLDIKSSGYLIINERNQYKYDFALRLINFGRRPGEQIKTRITSIEQENNSFKIVHEFEDEISNPLGQNVDTKIGQIILKVKNKNVVFVLLEYSYVDPLDLNIYTANVCYKMDYQESGLERPMMHASITEKQKIIEFIENKRT